MHLPPNLTTSYYCYYLHGRSSAVCRCFKTHVRKRSLKIKLASFLVKKIHIPVRILLFHSNISIRCFYKTKWEKLQITIFRIETPISLWRRNPERSRGHERKPSDRGNSGHVCHSETLKVVERSYVTRILYRFAFDYASNLEFSAGSKSVHFWR